MNWRPKCLLPWWGTLPRLPAVRQAAFALYAAMMAIGVQQVAAQSNLPVPKREEETPRERDVPLPPYPAAESLVRFPTNWTTNAILVDHKTLSVADDGVVRFTLVVRSSRTRAILSAVARLVTTSSSPTRLLSASKATSITAACRARQTPPAPLVRKRASTRSAPSVAVWVMPWIV
jgi:hypothetical protein